MAWFLSLVLLCLAGFLLTLWLQWRQVKLRASERRSKAPIEPSSRTLPGPPLSSAVTARRAFEFAWPLAADRDVAPQLFRIVSGEDIGPDGKSRSWEFVFILPERRAQAVVSLRPAKDWDGSAPLRFELEESLSPLAETPKGRMPASFLDSPEAVRKLTAHGAVFAVSRPPMPLTGKIADGKAVWEVSADGRVFQTSFAA